MLTLRDRQQAPELHLVTDVLHRRGQLATVGGSAYLASLMEMPTTAAVRHYAELVREKALLRTVINLAQGLQADAYEQRELGQILDSLDQHLRSIRDQQQVSGPISIHNAVLEAIQQAEQVAADGLTGLSTGFSDLDRLTNGWHPSDLIIIAARPGAGKTALALQFALQACRHDPAQAVVIFSLEMSRLQLVQRLLCSEARVDSMRMRRGLLTQQEWGRIMTVAEQLSALPLLIDDSSSLHVSDIQARAQRLQDTQGLRLVVIDYLQLLRSQRRSESRVQEVSEISRDLKIMARELNVPILALSQLNRSVEHRRPAIPQLSDLRDSGSLEQDGDVILFIYRPDLYDPMADPVARLIIAKQRNGPLGEVQLTFQRHLTRFEAFADPAQYTEAIG
jgi:replicative DNA helicase